MKMKHVMFGAALAGAAFTSAGASASLWQYTYTGNDFAVANPPFTTSDSIHFQFTSPYLLGPNLDDTPFFETITSWSLSVGPLHYNSTIPDSIIYSINFSTDPLSHITGYQFTTQTDVVAPGLPPYVYPSPPYAEEVFSFDLPTTTFCCEDGIYIPGIAMDSSYAYNSNPGTWSITSIPEPSTWAMALLGFAGLGYSAFRRNAKPELCAASG